jgi:lysophospholipase L1-like esterase
MRNRLSVLAGIVSTALIMTAVPASAAPEELEYAALGDSYSSGVGAPGQSGTCSQSQNAYGPLWAKKNGAALTFAACAGATTDTLRASQLSALNDDTDLVTLTIGGNDVGFAPAVITCTIATDAGCQAVVDTALVVLKSSMPAKFDATYDDIAEAAPNADVVVLGYPLLFDEKATSCGVAGLSIPKRKALNRGAAELNAVIKDRATAAGFTYGDVTDDFAGHGACAASPWINALTAIPATDSFHPNANGYKLGYLPGLEAAL